MLSAVWVATIPGTFLWVGHLGMADHHAAEVFTYSKGAGSRPERAA